MANGNIADMIKFVSVDAVMLDKVDTTGEIQRLYDGVRNAIIYVRDDSTLYFLDSLSNGGEARRINATVAHPLTVTNGTDSFEYDGSADKTVDVKSIHPLSGADAAKLKAEWNVMPDNETASLKCPFITIDGYGHVVGVTTVEYQLAGTADASLATNSRVMYLINENASTFVMKVIGKGTKLNPDGTYSDNYDLPDNPKAGASYKAVDANTYHYKSTDADGNEITVDIIVKNAGDVLICDNDGSDGSPVHWNVIESPSGLYDRTNAGYAPATGETADANRVLTDHREWKPITGTDGIEIGPDGLTVRHTNKIDAGRTADNADIFIPHAVKDNDASVYSFTVPRTSYDANGHITGIDDQTISVQLPVLSTGDYPSLTVKYKTAAGVSGSAVYDPNMGDVTLDLNAISVPHADNADRVGGKSVAGTADGMIASGDSTVPTSSAVAAFVREYLNARIKTEIDGSDDPVSAGAVKSALAEKVDASVYVKKTAELDKKDDDIESAMKKADDTLAGSINSVKSDLREYIDGRLPENPFIVVDTDIADGTVAEIAVAVTDPAVDKVYLARKTGSDPLYYEFTWTGTEWNIIGSFTLDAIIEAEYRRIINGHQFVTEDWYESNPHDPNVIYFIYEDE